MSEPTLETSWSLRPTQPGDERFLDDLFSRLHAADFAALSLPEDQLHGLIQMQARAQRIGYLRDFPAAKSSIVMADGHPIGRLLVNYGADAIHLIDIALLPEWQGRGIGASLLQNLQAAALKQGVPVQLSVQPGNPAMRLYNRLGFAITSGGMQLGMTWTPQEQPTVATQQVASQKDVAPATELPDDANHAEALLPGLIRRRFRPDSEAFELTLDRVQHHRPLANASFSLFFQGPLGPILPQALHKMSLLDNEGVPEREFLMFLVPVGPAGSRMEYEAVFNL